MGCDIHIWTEIKSKETGKWEISKQDIFPDGDTKKTSSPFDRRSYRLFALLADVRNNAGIIPISEPKGLPDDSEYLNTKLDKPYDMSFGYGETNKCYTVKDEINYDVNYHSETFLTLAELLNFDYDKTFENLSVSKVFKSGNTVMAGAIFNEKAKVGEGEMTTYKDFIGEYFFEELEIMKTLGEPDDVRVVFYFDN